MTQQLMSMNAKRAANYIKQLPHRQVLLILAELSSNKPYFLQRIGERIQGWISVAAMNLTRV